MDSKTKILFAGFFLLVLILVFFSYEKFYQERDYLVSAEVPCDPSGESCFIYRCDSETETCSGVPEDDTTYYKKIEKSASLFPNCDPNAENCQVANCDASDMSCTVSLCQEDNLDEECTSLEDVFSEDVVNVNEPVQKENEEDGENSESTEEDMSTLEE